MKVNPYFKLRISSKGREFPASVVCEIKINAQTATQFATGVYCCPDKWDYVHKRMIGNDTQTRTDNNTLDKIYKEIIELASEMTKQGLEVSANSVRTEYLKKDEPYLSLIEIMNLKLEKTKKNRSSGTYRIYAGYRNSFQKFLNSYGAINITPSLFGVAEWEKFLIFDNTSETSRHNKLVFLKSSLMLALRLGQIQKHVLLNEENPKPEQKDLIYLSEEQIDYLIEYRFKYVPHENFKLAFLFQCFTGMAINELVGFRKSKHIERIKDKEFIIIKRQKVNKTFPIPILKQIRIILNQINDSFNIKNLNDYNNFIKFLGEIINFDEIEHLTSHVGRKTAGFYLLNNSVRIEVVSAILGHSNITTTQKIYASILTETIDRETLHLQ